MALSHERLVQFVLIAAGSTACAEPSRPAPDSSAADERPEVAESKPGQPAPAVPEPAPPEPPVAGQDWDSPTLGAMKWIPAGSFTMGSPTSEPGRYEDETPHPVTLSRGFWMMRSEVTQGAWSTVMGSTPSGPGSCGDDCPVDMVSWEDAQTFAARAGERDGVKYRLATEAEWEWAARGGQDHRFAGSDTPETVGWVLANSGGRSHPACGREPNGYGLCDMTGNVVEWVGDWYAPYGTDPVTDPVGPSTGHLRVVRGGTWGAATRNVRVARRDETDPGVRSPVIGFRLVLASEEPDQAAR